MAKDPAVLFYTSDFLAGTSFFTDSQRGQYIKLLCEQHQIGHIPEQHMLDICSTDDNPVWSKFIKDDRGFWFNQRMDEEIKKRINWCESRRKNKLCDKRLQKKEEHMSGHMTEHMSGHMGSGNGNRDIDTKYSKLFSIIWDIYPKRIGRKAAERHFIASVSSDEDWANIQKALQNYKESDTVKKGFMQNGSTWFNNWKDWVDFKDKERDPDADIE